MASAAQNLEPIELIKKKHGKRYSGGIEALRSDGLKSKKFGEAIEFLLGLPKAKFDESLEVSYRLGVDPKQSDQMVRGAIVLPHGTGKTARVVVFAKGAKLKEAEETGADHVGADELIEKISGGWTDFDSVVATPDMMGVVSKVARILGPRGLMPNPKLGTVTMDVSKVVGELKKGRVEYRVEKAGIVHAAFGKLSLGKEKLSENFKALTDSIVKQKPSSAKGAYIRSVYLSTTMGPSIELDYSEFVK